MKPCELSAAYPSRCLPFYATNKSLQRIAKQWDLEHNVSLKQYELEHTFLCHLHEQSPPIVFIGAEESVLVKRVIARVAGFKKRPIIVVVVESADESLLAACYQQGADRVIAVPHCSARIFSALIKALQSRDVYYPPYRFSTATQTCSIGDRTIRLTTKTFDIAQYLFINQGKLIPKSTILRDVWGLESDECVTRRIEVHMSHVRRQLSLDGSLGWEVRSRRRKGYGIFQIPESINQKTR